jgi:galactofuranosylgalactofuranosylrhamnosyl-N-acetylglucosaminyl-diphospho-decaprenol beta-1,5/1,6-galactofuranosyltransferase
MFDQVRAESLLQPSTSKSTTAKRPAKLLLHHLRQRAPDAAAARNYRRSGQEWAQLKRVNRAVLPELTSTESWRRCSSRRSCWRGLVAAQRDHALLTG